MEELINDCFNGGDKEFICITIYGAISTNSPLKCRLCFNETSSKLAINCLLNGSYFT